MASGVWHHRRWGPSTLPLRHCSCPSSLIGWRHLDAPGPPRHFRHGNLRGWFRHPDGTIGSIGTIESNCPSASKSAVNMSWWKYCTGCTVPCKHGATQRYRFVPLFSLNPMANPPESPQLLQRMPYFCIMFRKCPRSEKSLLKAMQLTAIVVRKHRQHNWYFCHFKLLVSNCLTCSITTQIVIHTPSFVHCIF